MHTFSRLLLATGLALAASASFAQASPGTGGYVFGGVGSGKTRIDQNGYDAQVGSTGTSDADRTAWKVGAGWMATPNLGVEGEYVDFGHPSYANAASGLGVRLKPSASALFGVGALPVGQGLSLIGKAGLASVRLGADVSGPAAYSTSQRDTRAAWGVGAQYDITRQWAVRAEYENFGKAGNDANFTSGTGTGTGKLSAFTASVLARF